MWQIVMLFVIMAHAFQPLENIGHIAVYRSHYSLSVTLKFIGKKLTFKSLVIFLKNFLIIYIINL
jgi:hypothetical protein